MCRSVASNVSALSSGVANSNQTMQLVSSSLSKIPYGGFSPVRLQTGSPRRPSCEHCTLKLIRRASAALGPCSRNGIRNGSSITAPPVQRPLARQRVMLSHRVIAYYGLIRDSGFHTPTYALSGALCGPTTSHRKPEVPQFTLHVFHRRAALRTPVDCAIAPDCYFNAHTSLRHFRSGSAPTSPHNRVTVACVTRLQVSLYATARRLARPAPARTFTFELSSPVVAHRKRRV